MAPTRGRGLITGGAAGVALLIVLTGCAAKPALAPNSDRLQVVTTTALLRDLVENVGGSRVEVASIVPDGADPHSYEPTLRDARNAVYADVAFSNYALLEEHSVIRTLDANLRDTAINVSLAEDSIQYAAEIIPLVENLNLDTVWLGIRARGEGRELGATRSSQVHVSATDARGPGDVFAYLTGSFGDTQVYLNSADGFDAASGYRDDTMSIPADAHTHLSWAFTEPGLYEIDFRATLQVDQSARPVSLGEATVTFAVGVAPSVAAPGRTVIDGGHADVAVDVDGGGIYLVHDPEGGGHHAQHVHASTDVVVSVPARALDEVPEAASFRFLGRPGTAIYQLPQAVLGKHVHGEIDPHLWQNVRNVMAYVQLIRDTLIEADPAGAAEYHQRTQGYLAELELTDDYVRETIAAIPEHRRHLVSTHDAFSYLGAAYGIEIAGFVTPNPAVEPSLADRRKLAATLLTLGIPAVFLEPGLIARSSTLTEVAAQLDVAVCTIYSDAFDEHVTSYVDMMRFNADSLHDCLAH